MSCSWGTFIFFIIFIIKNWFWTKKYSCKFSQKSIVKKIQIGSNIIFSYGDEFIHMCNFLTINFDKNLQEYFFVQKQFLIIKKWKIKSKILDFFFKMADSRNLDYFKKEQCFSIATLACYITSLPKAIYEKKIQCNIFCASSYLCAWVNN